MERTQLFPGTLLGICFTRWHLGGHQRFPVSVQTDSVGLGWDLMYQVMIVCTQTFLLLFPCQNTGREGGGR